MKFPSSNFKSTVKRVDAYLCRDGQLFLDGATAEGYEKLIAEREVDIAYKTVTRTTISASGGLHKVVAVCADKESLEAYALKWKNRLFGYDPHIATLRQVGDNLDWQTVLTRSSSC